MLTYAPKVCLSADSRSENLNLYPPFSKRLGITRVLEKNNESANSFPNTALAIKAGRVNDVGFDKTFPIVFYGI